MPPPPPPNTILVNHFTFCAEHGNEYCPTCSCDHRMSNNILIEDKLGELEGLFELSFEVEERHPLNAYALGAHPALKTETSFQCERHATIDCPSCFDWVGIIKKEKEAEVASEHGRWLRGGLVEGDKS